MDLRAIILAFVGIIIPVLYMKLTGWDPNFPLDEATTGQLILYFVGWLLNLVGLPAAGAAAVRIYIGKKLKEAKLG